MADIFTNPTIDEDRARGVGTPEAQAPGPGFFESIRPGFARARAQEDWGYNQFNYESRALSAIQTEAAKRGFRPAPAMPADPRIAGAMAARRDGQIRELMDFVQRERLADPKFLPDYAGIIDARSLSAFAVEQRKAELAKRDAQLQGGSTPGALVGALGAGLLDPSSYIPVGGSASKSLSFGRQVLSLMGREAAANVGVGIVLEPLVQRDAERIGVDRTAGDVLVDLGVQAGAGAAIGGVALPAGKGLNAVGEGVKAGWEAAGTAIDRRLLAMLDEALPPSMRTPDEQAAMNVVERAAEVAESSPFASDPMGDDAHGARLDTMLDAIVNGKPLPDLEPGLPPPAPRADTIAPDVGREAAVRFVMNRIEGGKKLNTDSGGLTKYGVSQKAHPGLDIANLTEAQAKAIYVEDYWEPLGLDRYAPDTALVAFDAAINHGEGFARRILRDGTADPARMLALRRAEYARLIRENPGKYGRYKDGWENRLQAIESRLGVRGDVAVDPTLEAPSYAELELPDSPIPEIRVGGESGNALARYLPEGDDAPSIEVKPRRQVVRKGPQHVRTVLADNGGIRDDPLAGHDLVKGRGLQRFVPGAGPLIRDKGMPIDAAGELLWEKGYFGPPETTPRPSEAQVLDMIERAVREDVYKPEEAAGVARLREQARSPGEQAARDEIGEYLAEQMPWVDLADEELMDLTVQLRGAGRDIDAAHFEAVETLAQQYRQAARVETGDEIYDIPGFDDEPWSTRANDREAEQGFGRPAPAGSDPGGSGAASAEPDRAPEAAGGEGDGLDPFDDPVGAAAQAQSDSIEHDIRMAIEAGDDRRFRLDEEGEETSAADALAAAAEENAALDALRGCMAPPKGGDA